jgi:hypothetical protein
MTTLPVILTTGFFIALIWVLAIRKIFKKAKAPTPEIIHQTLEIIPKIPEPEIINPKLTQAIKEATEEREISQAQREKELYEKVLKERDRLLEDDYIYKLIKEAVVNNCSSVEIKSDNITITEKAVRSIPGLYLPPKIIGCFNYGCDNADREEPSSVIVYFQRRVNPMCL